MMENKQLEAKQLLEGTKIGVEAVSQQQERSIREKQMDLQRNQQKPQE
jgi:hypothetical protein